MFVFSLNYFVSKAFLWTVIFRILVCKHWLSGGTNVTLMFVCQSMFGCSFSFYYFSSTVVEVTCCKCWSENLHCDHWRQIFTCFLQLITKRLSGPLQKGKRVLMCVVPPNYYIWFTPIPYHSDLSCCRIYKQECIWRWTSPGEVQHLVWRRHDIWSWICLYAHI